MIDIETRERTNSKGQTYPQWFDSNGRMVGCGCSEAQAVHVAKYNWKPCHHMSSHNDALNAITSVDLASHVEDELRNSCCVCGRETKAIICYRCLS